ncbi:hypothetical protein JCM8547_001599 [Rhodosporidiobolus lusitaniae]
METVQKVEFKTPRDGAVRYSLDMSSVDFGDLSVGTLDVGWLSNPDWRSDRYAFWWKHAHDFPWADKLEVEVIKAGKSSRAQDYHLHRDAYSTYLAVVCWLQSERITFSTLSSSSASTENARLAPADRPAPLSPLKLVSPKSVYPFSHLLELPALSSLALANFRSQLTISNAAAELFSETSAYSDEIGSAVLEFVLARRTAVRQSSGFKAAQERAEKGEASEWEVRMWAKLTGKTL